MASKSEISALIKSYIKANGNKEITGPVMRDILLKMLDLFTDTSGMNYRGNASVAQINALQNIRNGDFYTCTDSGTITKGNVTVNAGDFVIFNLEEQAWHTTSQFIDLSGLQKEITGAATSITADNLVPDSIVVSDGAGKVQSGMTLTELNGSLAKISQNETAITDLGRGVETMGQSVRDLGEAVTNLGQKQETLSSSIETVGGVATNNQKEIGKINADIGEIRRTIVPNLSDGTAELNIASVQVQDSVILTEGESVKQLKMIDGNLTFDGVPVGSDITLDDSVSEDSPNGVKSSGIYSFVQPTKAQVKQNTADIADLKNRKTAEWGNIAGNIDSQLDLAAKLSAIAATAKADTDKAVEDLTVEIAKKQDDRSLGIIAASPYQQVLGRYNIPDAAGRYALIVGNGTSDDDRSNAFCVTWDGEIVSDDMNSLVRNLGGVSGVSAVSQVPETQVSGVLYIVTA